MKTFDLSEEVRTGYTATTDIKELWAVELDLLEKFQELCRKHELRYFAIGGTLLGAVRHKGFIPWDDDIDLAMPLNDYLKLIEIEPKELKYPYFLQNYRMEKGKRKE